MDCLNGYKQEFLPKLLNSQRHVSHHELLLTKDLKIKKIDIGQSSVKWGLRRTKKIAQTWDQRIPFCARDNAAFFAMKRALSYIYSKTTLADCGKKLIILKIGKEIHYG
jgi:hypothetical protein